MGADFPCPTGWWPVILALLSRLLAHLYDPFRTFCLDYEEDLKLREFAKNLLLAVRFSPISKKESGSTVSWRDSACQKRLGNIDDLPARARADLFQSGNTCSRPWTLIIPARSRPAGSRPSVRKKVPWGTALSSNHSTVKSRPLSL